MIQSNVRKNDMADVHFTTIPYVTYTANRHIEGHIFSPNRPFYRCGSVTQPVNGSEAAGDSYANAG